MRPANEAGYAAFIDAGPTGEGLPPELCSEGNGVLGGGKYVDWQIAVSVDWCSAYANCQWAGKRLCGRVEGNGGGVSDSEWYCDAGKPEGCAAAGYMYEDGKGTKPDAEKGKALVKKACEMGYRWVCKPRSGK